MTDQYVAEISKLIPQADAKSNERRDFVKALLTVAGQLMAERVLANPGRIRSPQDAKEEGIVGSTVAAQEICDAFYRTVERKKGAN